MLPTGQRFCPTCGARSASTFCPNDGTEMKPVTVKPVPDGAGTNANPQVPATPFPIPPPPALSGGAGSPAPLTEDARIQPQVRRKGWVAVVVIIVAAVAVIALGVVWSQGSKPPTVTITGLQVILQGPQGCELNNQYSQENMVLGAGQQFTIDRTLTLIPPYPSGYTCTIQSWIVGTNGQSMPEDRANWPIINENTPVVVSPGANAEYKVTLQAPNFAFTGVLTLIATVTSP